MDVPTSPTPTPRESLKSVRDLARPSRYVAVGDQQATSPQPGAAPPQANAVSHAADPGVPSARITIGTIVKGNVYGTVVGGNHYGGRA